MAEFKFRPFESWKELKFKPVERVEPFPMKVFPALRKKAAGDILLRDSVGNLLKKEEGLLSQSLERLSSIAPVYPLFKEKLQTRVENLGRQLHDNREVQTQISASDTPYLKKLEGLLKQRLRPTSPLLNLPSQIEKWISSLKVK